MRLIAILTLKEDPLDYYSRKGHHSIVLQAQVDHVVGWPGSCHDACILDNSTVFAKGEAGDLIPGKKQSIARVDAVQ